MNIRKNARLTPIGRERLVALVLSGQTPEAVARAAGVCLRTVCKWSARFKAEGTAGLADPFLAPTSAAAADEPGLCERDHRAAPPASVPQARRKARPRVAGDRQSDPASSRPEPDELASNANAVASLDALARDLGLGDAN